MKSGNRMITILGPTACGKTQLAVALADKTGGEIISADSRQVYRGMTIGTGKDLDDYLIEEKKIPFHLIDIVAAGEEYNLFRFVSDFKNVLDEIIKRKKLPVLCGGTGMYIEAVLKNFAIPDVPVNEAFRKTLENKTDQELQELLKSYKTLHNETDTENRRRLIRALEIAHFAAEKKVIPEKLFEGESYVFGISMPREIVRKRITERLHKRLEEGMIEEVKQLLDSGVSASRLIRYGLEYKYITQYLLEEYSYDEMVRLLNIAIHQFSKRQMTWFRGMERRGININWVDGMLPMEEKLKQIESLLEK
ncbi:MAG TPA: tRNA (adenosine(37)-N6)-dimethylallyltransferase MiaA [Bacteroidales bacterium]|nr:tRNA (adenosine(37)-N6)-dimethylallyltransferase MiaA [Bacteroidales bacterium]